MCSVGEDEGRVDPSPSQTVRAGAGAHLLQDRHQTEPAAPLQGTGDNKGFYRMELWRIRDRKMQNSFNKALALLCHQEADSVADSPYIGRARHIRNAVTSTPRNSSSLQTQEGSDVHTDMETSRPLLEDCRTERSEGKDRRFPLVIKTFVLNRQRPQRVDHCRSVLWIYQSLHLYSPPKTKPGLWAQMLLGFRPVDRVDTNHVKAAGQFLRGSVQRAEGTAVFLFYWI